MLRFDNLGLGDSAGQWSEGSFSLKVADTVRAAQFMRDAGKTVSLLVWHSFGIAAVLAAAQHIPETVAVATVGAPFSPMHVTHVFEPVLGKILSEGRAEVKVGGGRTIEIRRHFVEDLENADLTDSITGLRKPLMILHSPTDNTVGIDNASTIFRKARHPRSFVSLDRSHHLLTGKGDAARAGKIISVWAEQYLEAVSRDALPGQKRESAAGANNSPGSASISPVGRLLIRRCWLQFSHHCHRHRHHHRRSFPTGR